MTRPDALPESCAVAFKEWAGVCRALASGRQSLILRKGGVLEGPGGFAPEHDAFWLYPTHVHEAGQGLKAGSNGPGPSPSEPGRVELGALAVVEFVGYVDRPELLDDLADLHAWTEETVLRRFHYRRPGLWVLGVRVYRRPEPWSIEPTPAQAGCKSWVPLDDPLPTSSLAAVLSEAEHARAMDRLRSAVAPAGRAAASKGDDAR
jgi:hypothetical protein